MHTQEADIKADNTEVLDRSEPLSRMEPLAFGEGSRHRPQLVDLAFDLAQRSAGFRRSLPGSLLTSLAELVRATNCYYSNLIEGRNTHPIDIERALNDDYSSDARKRDLQLEAKAHVEVQKWIDGGGIGVAAYTMEGLQEIHRRFYELLPDDLQWFEDPLTSERERVLPGELRQRDVQVGGHDAISAGAVPRFLSRFEQFYGALGKSESILCAAAAHHRLLWLHPFLDGNGRVARLMSHAAFLEMIDSGAVWSVSRGLAQQLGDYKTQLARCDQTRLNDFDGRGDLSEEALSEFTSFFLTLAIDQVSFMEGLLQPDRLRTRILLWAREESELGNLPAKSSLLLEAALYRGELSRGEAVSVLGIGERQARRIVSALIAAGVLTSEGPKAPLRLAFPATLASRWLPGLFPDAPA